MPGSEPTQGTKRHLVAVLAAIPIALAQLAGDCVDGTTPNCVDPQAACGPELDATSPDVSATLPEASADAADGGRDAPTDADADLDAEEAGD